jgi:para-nitrobenzyl esterase
METNRRDFLRTLSVGTAGFGMKPLDLNDQGFTRQAETGGDEQQLLIGDDIAVADTLYGKVQGFVLRGIYTFRGIPYGADTGGANRFMPPQRPEPWEGVFPAVWWGASAPQIMDGRYGNAHQSFADHWNYDDVGEDCLRLNVWTPGIADGGNRPVLVWLHGGGYTNGNGIEQDGYCGENLSRKGDIVFVSINHRLGPIGFSDLSAAGGQKYLHSGNVGALDMVAALEWVRDNIGQFGGDPQNVTIMGQSGGGAKVCTLMAMPAAAGLFHKAVPLSGSTLEARDRAVSRTIGEYILQEAGLDASGIDRLQDLSWKGYLLLANRAVRRYSEERGSPGFLGGFGPVADGVHIPEGPFFSEPDGLSSTVPMLICSTFHEWAISRVDPALEAMSREEAISMLRERMGFRAGLGERAEAVYDGYARVFPPQGRSRS